MSMSPEAVAAYDVEILTGSAACEADVLLQVRQEEEEECRKQMYEEDLRGRCLATGAATHMLLPAFCAAQLRSAASACPAAARQHHALDPCMSRSLVEFGAAQLWDRFTSYTAGCLQTAITQMFCLCLLFSWPLKPRVLEGRARDQNTDVLSTILCRAAMAVARTATTPSWRVWRRERSCISRPQTAPASTRSSTSAVPRWGSFHCRAFSNGRGLSTFGVFRQACLGRVSCTMFASAIPGGSPLGLSSPGRPPLKRSQLERAQPLQMHLLRAYSARSLGLHLRRCIESLTACRFQTSMLFLLAVYL